MRLTAFLLSYGQPVGADLMTRDLLAALVADGVEVEVYADFHSGAPLEIDGLTVRSRHDFYLGERVGDVVYQHADYGPMGRVAGGARPLIYVAHNAQERSLDGFTRYAPDLAVVNSPTTGEALGLEDFLVVRSPLRVADYVTSRRKAPKAVTLVNLTPDKGARVFYHLAEKMPDVPFYGVRGGYGYQAVFGEPVPPMTIDWPIPDLANVQIVGPFEPADLLRVYESTRVLLAPSKMESWGRVGLEAACSGIPTLAADLPGLRASLSDSGTYLDPMDPDSWIEPLRALLEPGNAYREASRAARKRAAEVAALTDTDLAAFVASVRALEA